MAVLRPKLFEADLSRGFSPDRELFSYRAVGLPKFSQPPHLIDVGHGQLPRSVGVDRGSCISVFARMTHVLFMSTPFEIGKAVVGRCRIYVVDTVQTARVLAERFRYKSVNGSAPSFAVHPDVDERVPLSTEGWQQDSAFHKPALLMRAIASDIPVNAAHATHAADFVTFSFEDRKPSFIHCAFSFLCGDFIMACLPAEGKLELTK